MTTDASQSATEAAIFNRVIAPERASLEPEAARAFLGLDFQPEDQERMRLLAAKAADGKLTPDEEVEIESYNRVGHILALLQSKARLSLKNAGLAR